MGQLFNGTTKYFPFKWIVKGDRKIYERNTSENNRNAFTNKCVDFLMFGCQKAFSCGQEE